MKKKHVTVPRFHNPGKGRPMETLAYLSPIEHEMIRQMTDGTWERGPKGIRSYADDSMASQGRSPSKSSGPGGPNGPNSGPSSGLGQGGQGSGGNAGGSKASGSPNSGTSTGGTSASKSGSQSQSSSSTTTGSGGQRGAGSNYGPGSARPGEASTALGQASQAAQRNAVSASAAMDQGIYHDGFSRKPGSPGFNSLPGMTNPTQFDRTIRPSGFQTAAGVKYDNFTSRYDPNKLTPGAQKIHQAIVDNAFRTNQPVEFFSGQRPFNPRSPTKNHPSATAIDLRMMDPVTGLPVGYDKIGALAYNPIGSYNPRAGRSYAVAEKVQDALSGPYRGFATGVLNSFMDNPDVYGEFNNQRWGGSFGTDKWKKDVSALDYMHFDEGKVMAGVSPDQAALRKEAANYSGPTVSSGTMLAGGIPSGLGGTTPPAISRPTQVAGIANAGMGEAARLQKAQEALRAISAPSPTIPTDPRLNVPQGAFPAAPLRSAAGTYTAPYNPASQGPQRYSGPLDSIPSPQSIGMAAPASAFANDPRLNVPQGAYPARAQSMVAGDPRVSQTPLGVYPQAHQFANNERAVAPGHWGREEKNYLTQIGAMDRINRDPGARLGYEKMQNPDGSGLRIGPETNPFAAGSFSPETNTANLKTGLSPDRYSAILSHELGHAGAFAKNPDVFKTNLGLEEERQWRVDASLEKPNSAAQADALQKAEMYRIDRKHNAPLAHNTVFSDPRIASPLGAYPAAPKKDVQLAWNVPPLGGALPSWKADALGVWGTNRKPSGPAAQPGTIHSQTAQTEDAPSFWSDPNAYIKSKTGVDVGAKVEQAKTAGTQFLDGAEQYAEAKQKYGPLVDLYLGLTGGAGGAPRSGGLLGSPQDRSDRYFAPPQMPQPMQPAQQQMAQAPAQDQLSQLLLMQEQMIAEGASPEELAALQALIDQLSTQEA